MWRGSLFLLGGWGRGSRLSRVLSSHTSVALQEKQTRPAELPRLQLSSGFIWDVGLDSLTPALPPQGGSSDSEEDEKPQQATVSHFTGLCPFAGTSCCQSPVLCTVCGCLSRRGGVSSGQGVFMGLVDCPANSWLLSQTFPGSEELVTHFFFCLL